MTGRRHPIMDSEDVPPTDGDDINDLELHLNRRSHVAQHFFKADAQATIRLASRARNRIVVQPEVGVMVYY